MSLARALLFNIVFWVGTAIMGIAGLPFLLTPRRTAMRFGRFWAQAVLAALKLPPLLGDPAVVIKRELQYVPFYGWYAARAGSIFIDRKGGGAALRRLLTSATAAIAMSRPVVIFPQGTRTAPGQPVGDAPYQPGVAALYRELGVPLVPAAVNSGLYWGRRAFVKRPGRIVLQFLEPIPPGLPRREVMATLETRIEAAAAALEKEGRSNIS